MFLSISAREPIHVILLLLWVVTAEQSIRLSSVLSVQEKGTEPQVARKLVSNHSESSFQRIEEKLNLLTQRIDKKLKATGTQPLHNTTREAAQSVQQIVIPTESVTTRQTVSAATANHFHAQPLIANIPHKRPLTTNFSLGTATSFHASMAPRVVLLKTRKTGSSSLANIINRYGEKRNMTFLKPLGNNIWLNLTMLASKIPPFCKFDIIDNHLTSSFDPIELSLVAEPHVPVKLITSVREPLARIASSFSFFPEFTTQRAKNMTLDDVVKSLLQKRRSKALRKLVQRASYVSEFKLSSCGRCKEHEMARPWCRSCLARIYGTLQLFDVIVILERWEESMVLLRRVLGVEMEDVVSLPLKSHDARCQKHSRCKDHFGSLTPVSKQAILAQVPGDLLIYNYALSLFNLQLEREGLLGSVLEAEIELFRQEQARVEQRCRNDTGAQEWLCRRLGLDAIGYTVLLRKKMIQKLNNTRCSSFIRTYKRRGKRKS